MRYDPYQKWLLLPPGPRPPHHYALLGLPLGESDPQRIQRAYQQQLERVLPYKVGAHAALCQQLIDDLSRAVACLTSSTEKQAYDRQWRASPTWSDAAAADHADRPGPVASPPMDPNKNAPLPVSRGRALPTLADFPAALPQANALPPLNTLPQTNTVPQLKAVPGVLPIAPHVPADDELAEPAVPRPLPVPPPAAGAVLLGCGLPLLLMLAVLCMAVWNVTRPQQVVVHFHPPGQSVLVTIDGQVQTIDPDRTAIDLEYGVHELIVVDRRFERAVKVFSIRHYQTTPIDVPLVRVKDPSTARPPPASAAASTSAAD